MGPEDDAYTQTRMKLVVINHVLAIPVVVLKQDIEVGLVTDPPDEIDDCIEI